MDGVKGETWAVSRRGMVSNLSLAVRGCDAHPGTVADCSDIPAWKFGLLVTDVGNNCCM